MTFQLYSAPLSMFGMKVEIALREKGVVPEITMVAFDNARGYAPKHPEVLRINPKGQVPVLIHDGVELYDSTQIFEYIEDLGLPPAFWPADIRTRAMARQLEHASDEVFFPHVIKLMGLQDDLDGEAATTARTAAQGYYRRMEARFDGDYLAGDFSCADIAFFMAVLYGERLGAPLIDAETPQLAMWRDRVFARPAIVPVMARLVAYLRAHNRFIPPFMGD